MEDKVVLDKESLTKFLEEYFDVKQANAIENIYKDNNIPGLVENSLKICERFARPAVSVEELKPIIISALRQNGCNLDLTYPTRIEFNKGWSWKDIVNEIAIDIHRLLEGKKD